MVLTEGKTKQIIQSDREGEVLLRTKDDLTGGDAAKRETIDGISVHKTTQTRNVFELLKREGVPVAYLGPGPDATSLRCESCEMLPLELVMRRYAWGSFLKRAPDLKSTQEEPYKFDSIKSELFHKEAVVMPPLVERPEQMGESKARSLFLKNGVWEDGVFTDPLIHIQDEKWFLHPPKNPLNANEPLMETPALLSSEELDQLIDGIMIPVFSILEKAWSKIETEWGAVSLVDMKIECGRTQRDGRLVVADVIDNDSWRIWPGANPAKQLDKQCFRDGDDLSSVAENYELVARLTEQF